MYYRPTKVDFEGLKFLIMSAPVDSIMKQTIKVRIFANLQSHAPQSTNQ